MEEVVEAGIMMTEETFLPLCVIEKIILVSISHYCSV